MTQLEKEIHDQKFELRFVFDLMLQQPLELSAFTSADQIYFVGCGSSYYLAISAAKYFSLRLGKYTKAIAGGEVAFNFEENIPRRNGSSLAVLISRSGESTEMIVAAEKFKQGGVRTFSVTLNKDSKLFKVCDSGISLPIREDSIVMTKSFSSMLLSLFLIADSMVERDFEPYKFLFQHMDYFFTEPSFLDSFSFKHLVFLGSGVYEGIARESSLKVEEMSLTVAEAFSTLEYRHGPKALVDDRTVLVIFSNGTKEEKALVEEMRNYGAHVIERNSLDSSARDAFAQVIFSQLIGLRLARLKGVDPERPRNLTRVVELNFD
ncbi:SIS domain-containing protein [Pseudothermotoga sp.]